ncbi:flagellar hook-basal body complex protein FliE [bacterium]|nr:flagellar hook-basal body complex protein FliE [bacterium]
MNFIGGVQNLGFNPVEQYNQMLKANKSLQSQQTPANMEMPDVTAFDKVLSEQTAALGNGTAPMPVEGGIAMDYVDLMKGVQDTTGTDGAYGADVTPNSKNTGSLMNDFTNSINSGLTSVSDTQDAANKAQEAFASGDDSVSVHDVMIASEKSTLSLQMALQLRNKLLNAYSEINNVKV